MAERTGGSSDTDARRDRLRSALKDNLRRRKAQARQRAVESDEGDTAQTRAGREAGRLVGPDGKGT